MSYFLALTFDYEGVCDPMSPSRPGIPDRNLAFELVCVTEAAVLASGRWVGRGKKNDGDGAVVDAMRTLINLVHMNGVVVIGEGEKDQMFAARMTRQVTKRVV